ncbi:MAG: NACHT domain-containing protein, partial [Pyrinomonadaceae bacterium]
MSLKINRKTTEESLTENLEKDAKLLVEVSTLFAFAAVAMSGEPVSLAVGIALILKTAGGALSAGTNIVRRLAGGKKDEERQLPPYDRFRILFYITCQQCFIEALAETINQIEELKKTKAEKVEIKPAEVKDLAKQMRIQLQNLDEAEVTYLFCVEPLSGEVPLYGAFEKWSISTLTYYGCPPHIAVHIGQKSKQEARKRFRVYLAGNDDGAEWMRNYLALTQQQETSSRLVSDLAAIRETLAHWTDPAEALKLHQKKAWDSYRKTLSLLPDQKETMFNEQFGVRKVFVQPHVFYHVQGAEGDAGQAQPVPDLGRLLGALISSRLSGEDLVILCGGPGSGKSTLCRIMASELASDPAIHPVFLRLRRAKEGAEIGQYIEDSLQKLGLASRLADLREIPNLILILDGFDELVMASRARLRHFFNVLREDLGSGPLRNAKAIVSGRDTLFPRGEGLPNGSQVLSLQPFDKLRVRAWGTKWRLLHKKGPGGTFHPEQFIEKEQGKERKPPLQHLVSWPLTLHLVARVHTAGKLEVGTRAAKRVEKAYLYRSILAETSHRQSDQTEGVGRLDERK